MGRTIVFIHGAWVTPLCWDPFKGFFEARGYECLAPAWPYRDKPVPELRANPPAQLAGLGIREIVDHYARIVSAQPAPPILIGHSFGGLFVQLLLDRGLGAAGVAIDSAPPKGILITQPSAYRSLAGVVFKWGAWKSIVYWTFPEFRYAFVHTLPEAQQKAAYERHVVPETGRIFFQTALSLLAPNSAVQVNFDNPRRAPLLLIAGGQDHIVPPGVNRANYTRYKNSSARTDFQEFEKRVHWIIAQDGWEEVASYVASWVDGVK
jgi:pimeloyl-ACP methyl ester carboxylesterase